MRRQTGWLDGAVITGGEPTLQGKALDEFIRRVRDVGLQVMLETNGTGYELVTANRVNLRSYHKRGWLAQLDEQKMPNLRHIDRHRLDAFVALNEHSALVSGDVKESPARSEFYTRLPPRAARAPDIAFSRIVQ
jgi:organic radical activating enzyme